MNYTHLAGTPVTDPRGTVIDIDGEQFTIGEETEAFAWPLSEYDYSAGSYGYCPEVRDTAWIHPDGYCQVCGATDHRRVKL